MTELEDIVVRLNLATDLSTTSSDVALMRDVMREASDAIDTLRLRLSAVLQWTQNWNCPWEGEDEWQGDLKLAKDALRKL